MHPTTVVARLIEAPNFVRSGYQIFALPSSVVVKTKVIRVAKKG